MRKCIPFVFCVLLLTAASLSADPPENPQAPTVDEVFTPSAREAVQQTRRTKDLLHQDISDQLQNIEKMYTTYKETGCNPSSNDNRCAQQLREIRQSYAAMLRNTAKSIDTMEKNIRNVLPGLESYLQFWSKQNVSTLHDELLKYNRGTRPPREFMILEEIRKSLGLKTRPLPAIASQNYLKYKNAIDYIGVMKPELENLAMQIELTDDLSPFMNEEQQVTLREISVRILPTGPETSYEEFSETRNEDTDW